MSDMAYEALGMLSLLVTATQQQAAAAERQALMLETIAARLTQIAEQMPATDDDGCVFVRTDPPGR